MIRKSQVEQGGVPWAFSVACVALLVGGCSPVGVSSGRQKELIGEVKTRGLIAGFEGLQPFSGSSASDLVESVAEDVGLAHCGSSGAYKTVLPVIEAAHKNGQPIYLVGYSMGGEQARRLAEECQQRGIPVRILFLLDPRYMVAAAPGKVPANVRRVVFYTSGTYDSMIGVEPQAEHLADAGKTTLVVEDLAWTGHMALPNDVTEYVRREVAKDLAGKNGD